jgi:membrane-associated phospholipid phosphatase
MGSSEYPIIGRGKRPDNSMDCGEFINREEKNDLSYGMPSGHSNFSMFFAVVMIVMILKSKKTKNIKMIKIIIIIIISSNILFSRINLGCHTFQQVITGGMIGGILGYIYITNIENIKKILFKK